MSQSLSVSEMIRIGKMDVDFEVRDNYVTGQCVLYAERTAKEQEYMIREKSIVMLENRSLSGCVQEAKDLACQSALRHLSDISALTGAAPRRKPVDHDGSLPPKVEKPILHEPEPELEKPAEEEPLPIPEEPAEAADTMIPTEEPDDTLEPEEEEEPVLTGATQVGFADLRPASSLLKPEPPAEPDPDEDEAYQKACNMKITIVGKLHDCNGWTAGQILEKRPDVIVNFANRYNGPRTEERDALRTLYTEALRRVNQAA